MRSANPSVYQDLVRVSHVYLGPAAERFIDRQIRNHLGKSPEQLEAADVYALIDWIRIAVSFLTEDSQVVEAYVTQLKQIAKQTKEDTTHGK